MCMYVVCVVYCVYVYNIYRHQHDGFLHHEVLHRTDAAGEEVFTTHCPLPMGGDSATISPLTCFGDLSRNRTCGLRLASPG